MTTTNALASVMLLAASFAAGAEVLRVDSVSVDSIWNSDSSWYDQNSILVQRQSRDLFVSFRPVSDSSFGVTCSLSVSIDSGRTFGPTPDPLRFLAGDPLGIYLRNQKSTVRVRILGGDRSNVVVRVTCRSSGPPPIRCSAAAPVARTALTLLCPSGGATYKVGDKVEIKWSYPASWPYAQMTVDLYVQGGQKLCQDISTNPLNVTSGASVDSWVWEIPATFIRRSGAGLRDTVHLAGQTECYIRVQDYGDDVLSQTPTSFFSIAQ